MAKKNTYDADSIAILEGLEAVRKRPGMYIGSVSTKGLNHLIYEMVDNAVDEHLAGYCSEIHVVLEKDGSCTVSDNGRGVPVGMHAKGLPAARIVYTTLHAGGKFDDSAYKTSGGLHGVGSSVVNALSSYMDVEISREGYVHHDRYERGIPVIELEDGLLPRIAKTRKTGTKVNFLPELYMKTDGAVNRRRSLIMSRMEYWDLLKNSMKRRKSSMSRFILKERRKALRWKPPFSMSMNFTKMCWDFAIIFITPRAAHI